MHYHIQTTPIWEAYRATSGCPLCALRAAREARIVGQYLSDNVMDPDFRVASNAKGFCADHIKQMYRGQNKLGLALQLETRAAKLAELVAKPPADKKAAKKTADTLRAHYGCVICSALDDIMPRYYMTVAEMFDNEPEFSELFSSAAHCVEHAIALYDNAAYAGRKTAGFLAYLTKALKRELDNAERDMKSFADCFDFKNAGARPDPDAIKRVIALMITSDPV